MIPGFRAASGSFTLITTARQTPSLVIKLARWPPRCAEAQSQFGGFLDRGVQPERPAVPRMALRFERRAVQRDLDLAPRHTQELKNRVDAGSPRLDRDLDVARG